MNLNIVERILGFCANCLGIISFTMGIAVATSIDRNVADSAGKFLVENSIAGGVNSNPLLQFTVFSILSLSLAYFTVLAIVATINRTGLLAVVLLPLILGVSFTTSAVLIDIIYHLGQLRNKVEAGAVNPIVGGPMFFSVVYLFLVLIDREIRLVQNAKSGTGQLIGNTSSFRGLWPRYQSWTDQFETSDDFFLFFLLPVFFALFLTFGLSSLAWNAYV